jgi:hypothetical protein
MFPCQSSNPNIVFRNRPPFLCKTFLMRPYSLPVPMSHARTALTAAKFSMRAEFALGRPDLKAPKKSSPITMAGINISPAFAICFCTDGSSAKMAITILVSSRNLPLIQVYLFAGVFYGLFHGFQFISRNGPSLASVRFISHNKICTMSWLSASRQFVQV